MLDVFLFFLSEQVYKTIDLDEYLRNPETRMTTIMLFIFALVLELSVIGYFFAYPIYLDR
jgi:hypothetical protein